MLNSRGKKVTTSTEENDEEGLNNFATSSKKLDSRIETLVGIEDVVSSMMTT